MSDNVKKLFRPSLAQRWAEVVVRTLARLTFVVLFRGRCEGRHHFPPSGAALVCSNHQSHFDPVLVGLASDRRLNYLARKSLFTFAPFRWLIEFWDAIPIDRDGMGLGGIKETLKRLRRGEMVLIFPEGTRSQDGSLGELKPGFCSLARRGRVPLVPVGFDGAFDAWPRRRSWPSWSTIHIHIGEPMSAELVASLTDEQLIAELERRIRTCHERARDGRTSVIFCSWMAISPKSPTIGSLSHRDIR